MGQKVNPVGFRLGVNRGWDSVWYAKKKDFLQKSHEESYAIMYQVRFKRN